VERVAETGVVLRLLTEVSNPDLEQRGQPCCRQRLLSRLVVCGPAPSNWMQECSGNAVERRSSDVRFTPEEQESGATPKGGPVSVPQYTTAGADPVQNRLLMFITPRTLRSSRRCVRNVQRCRSQAGPSGVPSATSVRSVRASGRKTQRHSLARQTAETPSRRRQPPASACGAPQVTEFLFNQRCLRRAACESRFDRSASPPHGPRSASVPVTAERPEGPLTLQQLHPW